MYNVSKVINQSNGFQFDNEAYEAYSPVCLLMLDKKSPS